MAYKICLLKLLYILVVLGKHTCSHIYAPLCVCVTHAHTYMMGVLYMSQDTYAEARGKLCGLCSLPPFQWVLGFAHTLLDLLFYLLGHFASSVVEFLFMSVLMYKMLDFILALSPY